MRVTPERVDSLVERCKDVLAERALPPSVASSLAGKLYFTLSWAFGRMGRACLQPILHESDAPGISTSAEAAIRFLIAVLPRIRPMRLELLRTARTPVVLYTDGCHEGDTMDVGFIAGLPLPAAESTPAAQRRPEQYRWLHGGGSIPADLRRAFLDRKQQIGQVEIIAGIVAYLSIPDELAGRSIIHFIDNTSAVAGLCKGYSNMPDSARLVHAFHAWQSGGGTDVWFEYIPSKANPSDEPSRDPALWDGAFAPCPGVMSEPRPARFPALTRVDDPRAWQSEASAALRIGRVESWGGGAD